MEMGLVQTDQPGHPRDVPEIRLVAEHGQV